MTEKENIGSIIIYIYNQKDEWNGWPNKMENRTTSVYNWYKRGIDDVTNISKIEAT